MQINEDKYHLDFTLIIADAQRNASTILAIV